MKTNATIGQTIGRYEIRSEIGRGGMAVVYRAFDSVLEREVALKLLHPHLASHLESRERFQREAKAVARLKHPAVLEIHDYSGNQGDEVYLVTEIVEGMTLRRFLESRKGEPLSTEAAALIVRQVALALAHAHQNGVIHRDVKPENILISGSGEMKLSDFGIAQLVGGSQMTMTGQILGSPAYMSPEHIERAELDERADIFSVGTILYEVAVGRTPFDGKNPHAIIKSLVDGDYADPLSVNPAVGHHIATIIRRCLETKPDDRYRDAQAVVTDLDEALQAVDIDPSSIGLNEIFTDPDVWADRLRPKIIAATLALGISARRAHQLPQAADHFNRVLALDPGNDQALSAMAAMSRRRQIKRIFERAALTLTLLIIIGAVASIFLRDKPTESAPIPSNPSPAPTVSTPEPEPERNTPTPAQEQPTVATTVPTLESESLPTPRVRRPRRQAKPKSYREVTFTPHPMAVEIVIDGKTRFPFGPANRTRKLEVGKHKITFIPNDPKRFFPQTWTVDIPAGKTAFPFRERLRWRPGELLVSSNVNTVVTVPGRVSGRTNRRFEVKINKGPKETISVVVTAEGYVPKTVPVTIIAGELVKTTVNLVKRAVGDHPAIDNYEKNRSAMLD